MHLSLADACISAALRLTTASMMSFAAWVIGSSMGVSSYVRRHVRGAIRLGSCGVFPCFRVDAYVIAVRAVVFHRQIRQAPDYDITADLHPGARIPRKIAAHHLDHALG